VGYLTKLRHGVGARVGRPRRWRILERLPKRAVCAEIGVYKGDFSRDILRVTQPKKLHLIDGWWNVEGEVYVNDWYAQQGVDDTRSAYRAVAALASENPECELHVGDDLQILPTFPADYFDWVYLDTSHTYEHTVRELEQLHRVVKSDGIIAGHDWYPDPEHPFHGVYRAVSEYQERHGGRVVTDGQWRQWILVRDERGHDR
jgi:SAM-dependent methyltransferase